MLNEIIFLILAAITLVGAIKMIASDEPVHAAIYLGLVLGAVAGIYLTLSAEFLAAIQILIYVGAVVTLILFAVMLTTHASPTEGFAEDRTPLSTLGIGDAPTGMDVENLEEVPPEADTVGQAEAYAEPDDEDTVRRDEADDEAPDQDKEPEEATRREDEAMSSEEEDRQPRQRRGTEDDTEDEEEAS